MKFYIVYCVETLKIVNYCHTQKEAMMFISESWGPNLRWRIGELSDLRPSKSEDNWCFELFARNEEVLG